MYDYGDHYRHLVATCKTLVEQVRTSTQTPLLSCLLEGPAGSGKTALAATIGIESEFPYVKVVSAENMVGYSEAAKASQIAKMFDDAYRSPASIIVLDDIERLLEYVSIGPRFSNGILQTILVLLKKQPPQGRKLLVIGTTSMPTVMDEMEITAAFNVVQHVPRLKEPEIRAVFLTMGCFARQEIDAAVESLLGQQMPIKRLLLLLEMARQGVPDGASIPLQRWNQVIQDIAS
jgi:vesicle-fusing ATPase